MSLKELGGALTERATALERRLLATDTWPPDWSDADLVALESDARALIHASRRYRNRRKRPARGADQ